ncbi:MAG: hypothetical protein RBU21_02175 [FCB group bacterium]|nr:hypothetical protein [FCB group bacterium]
MEMDKPFKVVQLLVFCAALTFVVMGTYARSFGDAANSRLATVYSLTEYGTFYLDRPLDQEPNRFEQGTIDKVMANGHIISSKPPMLVLFMTGEYWLLNKAFGLDLNDKEDTEQIIRLLSMTLMGLPYLLILILFAWTLEFLGIDPLVRTVLLFCLAFCTQLWGYSLNINNHVPGAFLVVACLYLSLGLIEGVFAPVWWRFFLFGLLAGLVPTIDTPAAIFPFLAGIALLIKFPKEALTWALLGGLIPLGVHGAIMYVVTGSPFPVQTRAELYLYRGSYWRHPIQVDALDETKLNYLFNMTLGRTGLFALYPILFGGIAAGLRALLRKDTPYRTHILMGLAGFVILSAYYLLKTNNYGGQAYGFRWYMAAMPVLLMMSAPLLCKVRTRWRWIFVGFMIGISFYSAWECTVTPWAANHEWTTRFLGTSYK